MGGRITADRNVRHFKGFWFTSQFHHGHCLLKDADLIGFPGERQRERERERQTERERERERERDFDFQKNFIISILLFTK